MGTRAHWMTHRWRYREVEFIDGLVVSPPRYASTIAEVKADANEPGYAPRVLVVERRTGTKRAGYEYVFDRIVNGPTATCRHCLRSIVLMEHRHPDQIVAWGDSTRDPFYCPKARDLSHVMGEML